MRIFFQKNLWACLAALVWMWGAHATPAAPSASPAEGPPCNGAPLVQYTLGPRKAIEDLYPTLHTAAMASADRAMATAASIQLYLQFTLSRDQITDACGLKVMPIGPKGFQVSFYSSDSQAAQYARRHPEWLRRGTLALQGIQACQKTMSKDCWEPVGADLHCTGPWQFYLPLGLPMLSHKIVMLLHYPPYTAMQQSDYLNNATLKRWQRLLQTVGVAPHDWTLYTSTVDIFPIAAPGSGEGGCFTTANASKYFGAQGSGYIPSMLQLLASIPSTGDTHRTRPVIVFGGEATGYWNATYPGAPTAVNKAGTVALDPAAPTRLTAYSGANHPIAAVYHRCNPKPEELDIVTVVGQDLATACFARAMGDQPDADPQVVQAACKQAYLSSALAPEYAGQLCSNAVIDKSPQFAPWDMPRAKAWCEAHHNQVCPLPDYGAAAH